MTHLCLAKLRKLIGTGNVASSRLNLKPETGVMCYEDTPLDCSNNLHCTCLH